MEHQHSSEMSPVGESATDNCFLFALWGRRYISCVSPHLNAGCKAIKSGQSCRTDAPIILHIGQSQAMGSCEECLVVRWMRTQTLSTAITDLLMPSCLVHSATLISFFFPWRCMYKPCVIPTHCVQNTEQKKVILLVTTGPGQIKINKYVKFVW